MAHIEYAPRITYGTHTSEEVADLSLAHFFAICTTDKVAQIYKLAAPPPPFHSYPSNTKLDLAHPPPPHHLNFSILSSILGC
jgi:hypothetical protein